MQQYKFAAATCFMKDVLPVVSKLGTSLRPTLTVLKNELSGELDNYCCLVKLHEQVQEQYGTFQGKRLRNARGNALIGNCLSLLLEHSL